MENIFYPKQINKSRIKIFENQCFFAMPFSQEYTNLYDTLVLYLQNDGYKCIRVDNNLSASVPIINLILNGIASSQFIIVDISETNANVFYELGITHTIKDFENVFIIKEKNAKTPFDIQHLQYIQYDRNNLKELAIKLLEKLKANQYRNSLKKILFSKQLLKYDDVDDFVSYFTKQFEENKVCIYTEILDDNWISVYSKAEVTKSIWDYDEFLRNETARIDKNDYIDCLFKILFEMLVSICRIDDINIYINEFLHCQKYGLLNGKSLLSYQTDLAIKLAENSRVIEVSVNWIIEYFQRSKSTNVDLNRHKLEAFLLKNDTEQINEYIINAIFSDNKYVREHMADIIGEKKLLDAEDNLIIQLKREPSIYTIASIVEALGKIGSKKSIDAINEWLEKNAENAINKSEYFVLKHFRNAILRIDAQHTLKKFDEKYLDVLKANNEI